jgi:hypothetical protein
VSAVTERQSRGEESRSLCPFPHDDQLPRNSTRGTVLCSTHEKWLWQALVKLARFEADADAFTRAGTARHDSAPLTGSGETPMAINARLADLRHGWTDKEGSHGGVHATLVSWVKMVAEEREVSLPEDTIPALTKFLRKHHAWSIAQPWVDDYATEFLSLSSKAHSLFNPSGRRQWTNEHMRCPEPAPDERGEMGRCDGTLWALLTPSDPFFYVANELWCDVCETRTPSSDWLTLGRRVKAAEAA